MAKVTRRDFVKGAAAGAVVVAGAGILANCTSTSTSECGVPEKWDKEVDVIVLGTGTVIPAALVPAHAGLEVLVLEKAAIFGGTTAVSGGGIYIPNNYLMIADGVDDSKSKAFTFMKNVVEGQASDELINAYLDYGNEMLEWLRDNAGFKWQRTKGNAAFPEYYPYEGNVGGLHRRVQPVPFEGGPSSGPALARYAQEAFETLDVEILYETPGKRLIYKGNSNVGDGEVIGVIAESDGDEMIIKARRGVIIGTGGFDYNREMVRHFLRGPIHASNAVPTNTGDGHLMGMAVGAALRNMNECWGLPFFKPDPNSYSGIGDWQLWRGRPGTIVVNKHGERIGNESTNYDASEKAFHTYDTGVFEWRNIPSFFICDSGYASRYAWPGSYVPGGAVPAWMTEANSLDELATALNIDAAALIATVQRFNGYAEDGVDPEYHRGENPFDIYTIGDRERTDIKNPCLAPLETPPYYGTAIWPGTCGTNGGLLTNGKAQVINVWGDIIPRLYCTSNTMASAMGVGYAGGGATLGPGMTFGYIAGKQVTSLTSWED